MRVVTYWGAMAVVTSCVAGSLVAGHASALERDWKKYPAVVELETPKDIFAIGDPHGDPHRLRKVLAAAGLIRRTPAARAEATWSGGESVLVVTGDLIDKGNDSIGVIELLRTLQVGAAADGGRVIVTMGNHEAEFLARPLGKKTKEFRNELEVAGLDPVDTANCNGDIGKFLCRLPIAARVNDWFFSHGGNTKGMTIDELTAAIQDGFAADGFDTDVLVGTDSILEARLNKKGPGHLPWFEARNSATDPKQLLSNYAKRLGVNHLVQGHQPGRVAFPDEKDRKEYHFFQRYGLLFLIDTGMSDGIDDSDSIGGALRITGTGRIQEAIVICADGEQKMIWSQETRDHEQKHCSE
jgi:hypothetical protein